MSCGCGKKKCNGKCGISPSVLQINNNECTLFHKVEIPAVMGDETTNPPKTGAYRNVLLYYEASGNSYLYSSDGIPTKLTGVVSDYEVLTNKPSINGVVLIKNKTLADLGIISAIDSAVADEATARTNADNALSDRITTNANNIAANATAISNEVTARTNADNTLSARISGNTTAINNEKTARENADTALSNRITANANAISAETTARENADNALSGRITANADAISGEKTARENADAGLQDQITAVKATADSAVQPDDIDKTVMSDLAVDSNSSTAQVILKESKVNLKTGATSSEQTSLPVASSSQAGVMNSATYDAVASNTSNINAIMNGAVAITGLPANPSQSDLTTAWQNETGLSTLINRASVYDVTNNKVWTYYTNDTTWHVASNTSQVTVNTFTNSSEGTIKGSTSVGQVFAENDGTGSVNGWDALSDAVSNNTSKLAGIESGAEVNVQSDWNVSDSSSDAYIKNKPTIGNGTLTIQKNGTTIDTFTANSTTNKTVNITVPTVNDATLTIQKNGDTVQTFTANSSSNKTANIEVPTKTSELDNDAGFIANDTHQVCGEGGDITLDTTTFEPLEMNYLGGNTEQQTYTGKNLLKYPYKDTTVTRSGITFTDNGDGTVTANGTATTEALFWITNDIWSYSTSNIVIPAGTYTISKTGRDKFHVYVTVYGKTQGQIGTFNSSTSDATFTTTEEASLTIRLSIKDTGVAVNNFVFRPQIESGSTATAYEPYVGGIASPNPDYPQAVQTVTGENVVKICGKNLLPNRMTSGTIAGAVQNTVNSDGSFTLNGTATAGSNVDYNNEAGYYVHLEQGQKYTLSVNNSGLYWRIRKIATSTLIAQIDSPATRVTFTANTTEDAFLYFVVLNNSSFSNTNFKVQFEKGSTPTAYEPYQSQSYEINLGNIELCKIGTYQDYIYKSGDKWYVHKETGKRTYTAGDITIAASDTYSNVRYAQFPKGADNKQYGNYTYGDIINFFTNGINIGTVPAGGWNSYISDGLIYNSAMQDNYWCSFSKSTVLATMQEKLDGMVAYYVLATATDTEITNEALVAQLEALWEADGYDSQTNIALAYAEGNAQGILSVCQYPSHLPVATKSKLGTIIVGHGLDIEDDGRLDVIVDSALSESSINPVQNKAITTELNSKADISSVPTKTSQLENDSGFVVNDTTEICDEGSDITLNGTLLEPLDVKKIEGATSQQTYTGKNLLPIDFSDGSGGGLTWKNNGDGTVTVSGTTTMAYAVNISPSSTQNLVLQNGKTYTQRVEVISGNFNLRVVPSFKNGGGTTVYNYFTNNQTKTATDTMTCNAYDLYAPDSGIVANFTIRVWLEEGSDLSSPYEPYVGGIPAPNPDYPQAVKTVAGENVVKICGKNLYEWSDTEWSNPITTDAWCFQNGSSTAGGGAYGPNITDKTPYKITLPAGTYKATAYNISSNIVNIQACKNGASSEIIITSPTNMNSSNPTSTITLTEQTTLCFRYRVTNPSLGIGDTKIQVERDSATDYEPYQGSEYMVKLNAGINYWDNLQSGFLPLSGAYPTTNPSYPNAKYRLVSLKPGQSIRTIFTGADNGSGRVRWINPTTNEVVGVVNQGTYEYYSSTRNFGDGFYDAVITANKDVIIGFLDIGYGYTQADFTIEPINFDGLELCKIGDYQDSIYKSGDKWYIHKETGKITLSGSENWTAWASGGVYRYYTSDYSSSVAGLPQTASALSDHFRFAGVASGNLDDGKFWFNMSSGTTVSNGNITFNTSTITTAADWKTWLASNNTTVYCPLATATDTEITNETLIAQLNALADADGVEGETNIFTVSDGVNERAILSVCQYPSHLPIATKTKLGTIVVGHGLDIEADGKLDVIVDDDFSTESDHPVQNKVITNALAGKADNTDLSTVAMTGSYDDLTGKPTIPTVNNATLTIQKNGTNVATFTANSSTNVTANITAPVVTMTTTDPGEGGALAANNFIGVYV